MVSSDQIIESIVVSPTQVLRQHLTVQQDQEGLRGGGDISWILSDMLSKAFFQKMGTAFPMERVTCTKAWKQETD